MTNYFETIFRYNAWANERVMDCLKRQNIQDEKIRSLFGHTLVAQLVWLNRILSRPAPRYSLWGVYELDQLQSMMSEANSTWREFVGSNTSFDQKISYTNSAGDKFTDQADVIMIHVVNHCTYHRGQIAARIRQNGLEPVGTDFITWDRIITGQLKG